MTAPLIVEYAASGAVPDPDVQHYAVLFYRGRPLWSTHAISAPLARARLETWWAKEGPSKARSEKEAAVLVDDLV